MLLDAMGGGGGYGSAHKLISITKVEVPTLFAYEGMGPAGVSNF